MSESLLSAEQAIRDLLGKLQDFKDQTEGYSAARDSLQNTSKSLNDLIDNTSTLSEKALDATVALKEIGTPEILAKVAELATGIQEAVQVIRASATSISNQGEKIGEIEQSLKQVQEQNEHRAQKIQEDIAGLCSIVMGDLEKKDSKVSLLTVLVIVGLLTSIATLIRVFFI